MAQLTGETCQAALAQLVQKKPLVHCITNFVSMDIMANSLCAIGASPAMVHSLEEVEEFSYRAHVLLVNVGTLSKEWFEAMKKAIVAYSKQSKPWVLDPVAAGGTTYRTNAILELLRLGPAIVRGNASEINSLAHESENTGGVDSTLDSSSAVDAAKSLAIKYSTVIAVSGKIDYVTDGFRVIEVHHGCYLMSLISAAGCTVTALIAAFLSAADGSSPKERLEAAVHALAIFGYVAEKAFKDENSGNRMGPGTLRIRILDGLYQMTQNQQDALTLRIFDQ